MQNIGVSDITMKVADQAPELSLSFKEKIELAKLLDRLNVSVIEVSPIRSRKIDSRLIKSIAMAVKHATIAVPVTLEAVSYTHLSSPRGWKATSTTTNTPCLPSNCAKG